MPQSQRDEIVELLSVGPLGGIDPTTPPYYVASPNYVDGANFVPNQGYGGFSTVQGRLDALITQLPNTPNGIHCFHRQGLPDVYLFAVDIGNALDPNGLNDQTGVVRSKKKKHPTVNPPYGQLYYGQLGGTAIPLTLPQDILVAGKQTYFADCGQWVFVTNGVDTPLKIDTSLNVTFWGIAAPTVAPTGQIEGAGVLVGQYYYCFTYSNALQESSQGTISKPITCATATATSNALNVGDSPVVGDVLTVFIGQEGLPEYSASYTVLAGLTDKRSVAQGLANAININPYTAQYATAGPSTNPNALPGALVLTASVPGTLGNQVYYYTEIQTANLNEGATITPNTITLLTGGLDGQTVRLSDMDNPKLKSSDPQVTQLNIYRLGGSLGTWNLITTLTKPFPEYYYDTIADSAITGQQLVVFRDPPAAFSYIATHMERVFGFGVNPCPNTNGTITADPSLVWWSNLNEPWGFNSNVNTFTCGDNHFSDVALGLAENGGVLMALKTRRAYWIYGSTDTDFQPIFAFYIGCDAPRSIAVGYGLTFWHGRQGVFFTDGSNTQQISDGMFQQSNVKNILDRLSASDFAASVGFFYDRQYYLSFPTQGFTLMYDTRFKDWHKLSFATPMAYFDLNSDVPVIAADDKIPGQIDQWFASPCDLNGPVTAYIQSGTSDAGAPHATKQLMRGLLLAPIQPGAKAKLVITVDPGCSTQSSHPETIDLGTGTDRHEFSLPLMQGFKFNIWVCVDGPAIIDKIAVYGTIKRVHEPDNHTAYGTGKQVL